MIDAHQHFWRIARGDYTWMDGTVARIRKDFLPDHLQELISATPVTGTVVVQAAPSHAETRFLISLAKENPMIKGVVGWANLTADDANTQISRLTRSPIVKGLRPMLQDIADTDWIMRADVLTALAYMANKGLRLDALVTPRHLPNIKLLAQSIPKLQIVIDHCAKPVIAAGQDPGDTWRRDIRALAEQPNVFAKLSGLANEAGCGWTIDMLRPVFDHMWACFGPDRLMWGSDWPVLNLAGDYEQWLTTALDLVGPDLAARDAVFGGTATKFYGLEAA